jgi:DNA-binding NtrC family response regulator
VSSVTALLETLIRPPKLLLVEDDEAVGAGIVYWLEHQYECELKWAKTGEDALACIDQLGPFDLIFLNLCLPGISGVDVLRAIKAKWPNVPVVIVTGYTQSNAAQQAAEIGVVGILAKPIDGKALDQVFRTYKVKARTKQDAAYFREQGVPAYRVGGESGQASSAFA